MLPSKKVTLPTEPGTLAVNVTGCPNVAGLGVATSVTIPCAAHDPTSALVRKHNARMRLELSLRITMLPPPDRFFEQL
jgi:hypothetical protein